MNINNNKQNMKSVCGIFIQNIFAVKCIINSFFMDVYRCTIWSSTWGFSSVYLIMKERNFGLPQKLMTFLDYLEFWSFWSSMLYSSIIVSDILDSYCQCQAQFKIYAQHENYSAQFFSFINWNVKLKSEIIIQPKYG